MPKNRSNLKKQLNKTNQTEQKIPTSAKSQFPKTTLYKLLEATSFHSLCIITLVLFILSKNDPVQKLGTADLRYLFSREAVSHRMTSYMFPRCGHSPKRMLMSTEKWKMVPSPRLATYPVRWESPEGDSQPITFPLPTPGVSLSPYLYHARWSMGLFHWGKTGFWKSDFLIPVLTHSWASTGWAPAGGMLGLGAPWQGVPSAIPPIQAWVHASALSPGLNFLQQ